MSQRIGLHVSAAGGAFNAPKNAHDMGAEVFQFFSRSPRGGKAPVISNEDAQKFKDECKKYNLAESYIHTPYYINFASDKKSLSEAAPRIIREELERASALGVKYIMTHLGSAKDMDRNAALKQTVKGLKKVYAGNPKFSAKLLLEISAGAGNVIGDSFEELGFILKELGRKDAHVCLDTCHMFASGYDLRDKAAVEVTMKEFRKYLKISDLKLVHLNDSKNELNSHKDRHEHLGEGHIGVAGFKALFSHKDLQKTNFILETKHDAGIKKDLAFVKKWRKAKS